MKTKIFTLLLVFLLCGIGLSAKTINKIVFKRSISGPVKLKDSAGGWYTVTNGESFSGEYNFIRGYDGDCNGLSVRHKGEYARPGDNRSDFIRTWYVGESVYSYYDNTYHDCPNRKSQSSNTSSTSSSRNSSSSSYNSSSSSYGNSISNFYQSNTAGDGTLSLVGKWGYKTNPSTWYIEVTNDNGQYSLRVNSRYETSVEKIDDYTFDVHSFNHEKKDGRYYDDCSEDADPGYRTRGVYYYDEWYHTDYEHITLKGDAPHVKMYKQHTDYYLRGKNSYKETHLNAWYFTDDDLVRYQD